MSQPTSSPYLLEMQGMTKRFPGGVTANKDVDLRVRTGSVHALLGENGAGKSTLMNLLIGLTPATSGSLLWKGRPTIFRNTADSMSAGIGMVHQHFQLIPPFTVWENIILGHEPGKAGVLDKEQARADVRALSKRYGLEVDPDARVEDLSVGEQQRIEILKALYRDIDLLILDEPTAVLTPQETESLFTTLRSLVADGLTVIFISHKLREVLDITDHLTILRKGEKVLDGKTQDYDLKSLASAMIGRPPSLPEYEADVAKGDVVFEARKLCVKNNLGLDALHNLSLSLHSGEIVGVAGVEGNGQSELLEAISGLRPLESGALLLGGEAIHSLSPRQRFKQGMSHVPEDRHQQALVLSNTMKENLVFGRHTEDRFLKAGFWLDEAAQQSYSKERIATFGIEPPSPELPVNALSGGNQQKVVVAREFGREARFHLVAHPTRGVDIGAIEAIHGQLLDQKKQGAAILLFSSELPELLALSDRLLVLYEGKIVGELSREEADETTLGILMTGGSLS